MIRYDKNDPKSPAIFYIYYFVVYFGIAIQGSFLTLYLTESGLPVKTIGLLNGIIQILSLFVLPVLGRIADRAPTKNKVLCIELAISITILFMLSRAKNLIMICVFRILYAMFFTPISSVYETITMEYCRKNGWEFGPIRMSGTIGYSIMSFASGFGLKGNIGAIFPMLIGSYMLTFIIALLLPRSSRVVRVVVSPNEESDARRVFSILKDRQVRNVMIMFFVYSLSSSVNNTYFGNYAQELGGDYAIIGIAHAVLGLSELPFHLGPGKRWLQKIGVERSLLVVLAVGTFRWTVCSLTNDPWVLTATMALNGIQLVPVIIGMAQFLYDHAPEDLKVTAQTTLRHSVQVIAVLVADFAGSGLHHLFELLGKHPIKGLYACMIPLNILGIIMGLTSIRKGNSAEQNTVS